jgi:hypothetical protein
MVGRRRVGRGRVLSPAVGRRGRDAKIVLHDGGGADRRDGRPPRDHLPDARGGRDDRADDRAGGAGASEFPDVQGGIARHCADSAKPPINAGFLSCRAEPGRRTERDQNPA